jgi:hypothetical protein
MKTLETLRGKSQGREFAGCYLYANIWDARGSGKEYYHHNSESLDLIEVWQSVAEEAHMKTGKRSRRGP